MFHRAFSLPVLFALAPLAAFGRAQSIFVTTTADVVDFGGAKTVADLPGPDGKVSLREACTAANNTAGAQVIGFHVPVGQWGTGVTGPVLINAGVSFPITGDDTTVDGTTQTAFTGDTNPNGAEVSFFSTSTDVNQIQSGIFSISSDRNVFVGLGDMLGRNYGLDFQSAAEDGFVVGCAIKGKFAAIRVQGDRITIGGMLPGQGNRLSSLSDGLRIHGFGASSADGNIAIGNDITGEFNGVQIVGNATGNRIGGFAPGEGNWIHGAGYLQEDGTPDGAMVRIESDGNLVYGNRIGTDALGTSVVDNPADVGVEIYGDANVVRGNVIGGISGPIGFLSVQAGVSLREGAQANVIQGNWIGVDASGAIPLSNGIGIRIAAFDGSLADPTDNLIGGLGAGEGNVIAFNETGGVAMLLTTSGNRVSGNEIRDNHALGGLAIDLGGDGATPNDPGDVDSGPNQYMNAPVVASAVTGPQGTVVIGTLDTPGPAGAVLEFYANPAAGPGAIVEAAALLGSGSAKADGSFQVLVAASGVGLALTATATDAAGNTSELSAPSDLLATPWADLGFGLAGSNGVPVLAGGGPLQSGTQAALVLAHARASSPGFWVVGAPAIFVPVLGGTLVPSPQAVLPFATNASGQASFAVSLSGAIPSGAVLYAQAWVLDPLAAQGVAASNGVAGTAP